MSNKSKNTTMKTLRIPKELLFVIKARALKADVTSSEYIIKVLKRECLRKR